MKTAALFFALIFALAAGAAAQQSVCLSNDDAKKVVESMKPFAQAPLNKKLAKELTTMRAGRERLDAKISADTEKNQNLIPEVNKMSETHLTRVCQMLRENGWLTRELVGDDGFEAFIYLITQNKNIRAQEELLPVLTEASKKGYIGNPLLASFVDSIRVGYRMPQVFGTQAAIRNNVVYLYPLLNEEKVDEWRAMYNLPPLSAQIRNFEMRYAMPVLKSFRQPVAPTLIQKDKNSATQILGFSEDEEAEPIQVETRLVNLNARVLTQELKAPAGLTLTKDDFTILEDGAEQEISFYSNTDQPFDLVLLLDFSVSTIEKRGDIIKAAERFVEVARPGDRIAIVAFATDIKLISDLSSDKTALRRSLSEIAVRSVSSSVWDSIKFVYANVFREKTPERRRAVVFMTDGEDTGPRTTFADVMEMVRRHDATVFPVYFGRPRGFSEYSDRLVRKNQQSLWMLAEESGGQFYSANDGKDLKGIYEQVAGELRQVYSLGYEPKNEKRDGGWRALTVKIKSRPELVVKTRRGYYAN